MPPAHRVLRTQPYRSFPWGGRSLGLGKGGLLLGGGPGGLRTLGGEGLFFAFRGFGLFCLSLQSFSFLIRPRPLLSASITSIGFPLFPPARAAIANALYAIN